MLEPEVVEVVEGRAEVRQIFRVGKSTVIAGCYVTDGRIVRTGGARVWRGGKVIATDRIDSLRRFRDDVREVAPNFECGIGLASVQRPRRGRHHRVLHPPDAEPDRRLTALAPMTQRTDRIDELLRQEIGALLTKEVADPRIGFATITDVETSPDLRHAKVWVQRDRRQADRDETLRALQQAMPFIRHELGRRLRIRRIPELHVRLDDSAERGTRVLQLLTELEAGRATREAIAPFDGIAPDAGPRGCPTRATPPTRPTRRRRAGRAEAAAAAARRPAARTGTGRRRAVGPSRAAARPARAGRATASPAASPDPASPALAGMTEAVDLAALAAARSPTRWWRACGGAREVLAVSHENPDADTLGATLGVRRWSRPWAARATAAFTDAPPPIYDFLPGIERVRPDPEPGVAYDLLVLVRLRDGRARRRGRRPPRGAVPRPAADDHRPPRVQRRDRRPADWVDPHAAATCEMVALLAVRLGVPLDAGDGALATALMAGIVMDTATFAHPNATPRTLAVSAALVEAGAPAVRHLAPALPHEARRAAPAVRPRARRASATSPDGRIIWSTLDPATSRRPGALRAHSEGIIDLLAAVRGRRGRDAAQGAGRRDHAPSASARSPAASTRRCSRGPSAAAATRARPARRSQKPLDEAVVAVGAEAARLAAAVQPVSRGGRSGGLDGVLIVAKPSGPTSHDVVGLVRRLSSTRRVGHGGTLDPFAAGVLPVFLGRATRLVEYHLGSTKRYRATICFGERSTTDDIDGERTPVDGPPVTARRRDRGPGRASPARSARSRPTTARSRSRDGGRTSSRAPGEPVELAPREVTIHALDLVDWDAADPARPVAVVDVSCSAGTYIRALARDLGEHLGTGAYLGALVRTASGGFRLEDAMQLDDLRAHAGDGPAGIAAILRPIDAGLEELPHAAITERRDPAPRGGPDHRAEDAARDPRRAGRARGGPRRDGRGGVRRRRGRAAPAQGPRRARHDPARPHRRAHRRGGCRGRLSARRRRPRRARGRARAPRSWSSACSTASIAGTRTSSSHLVAEAGRRGARPVVITFDHHPDEVLTGSAPPILCDPDERIERLEAAGVDTTVDRPLRPGAARDAVRRVRRPHRRPDAPRRLPDDPRRGVRLPAGRDARGARRARRAARGFEVVVVPAVRGRRARGQQHADPVGDRRGRPRVGRRACSAGRTRWWGRQRGRARGACSGSRSPSPCLRKPDTGWASATGSSGALAETEADVEDAVVRLPGDRGRAAPGWRSSTAP